MNRIKSIDITRGLVMVIMALDHVRDFMHTTSMTQSPTDLQTTTTLLFMTRWVTHLCAPTFVFLSGVSDLPEEKRSKIFLKLGIAALSLFIAIRFINIYGDPLKWSHQKSALFTFLSFINTTKYPLSLLFTLLFLGIMFVILFISEKLKNRFTEILTVYGKVPLFYFIIHLFIIHSLMFLMLRLQGIGSKDLLFGAFNNGRPKAVGGVDLPVIYLIWISVVVLLYPVCKWYGSYKSLHKEKKLLRYL